MTTQSQLRVYDELVDARKACARCNGLRNPAEVDGGRLDGGEVGPWSSWQGNLDAELLVVGQDWGDVTYFRQNDGFDAPSNPTNRMLVDFLSVAGVTITPTAKLGRNGEVFFTNAILCLKDGGLQAPVLDKWFENCGAAFLRPTIEVVQPRAVVALGEKATRALATAFGLKRPPFAEAVARADGLALTPAIRLFPRYHCGARSLNMNRRIEQQRADWARIGEWLTRERAARPRWR